MSDIGRSGRVSETPAIRNEDMNRRGIAERISNKNSEELLLCGRPETGPFNRQRPHGCRSGKRALAARRRESSFSMRAAEVPRNFASVKTATPPASAPAPAEANARRALGPAKRFAVIDISGDACRRWYKDFCEVLEMKCPTSASAIPLKSNPPATTRLAVIDPQRNISTVCSAFNAKPAANIINSPLAAHRA